jgi:hypothetical protein
MLAGCRIVRDENQTTLWKVRHYGRLTVQSFSSRQEAAAYLNLLITGKKKPVYEAETERKEVS